VRARSEDDSIGFEGDGVPTKVPQSRRQTPSTPMPALWKTVNDAANHWDGLSSWHATCFVLLEGKAHLRGPRVPSAGVDDAVGKVRLSEGVD
jgi:hypothetical protein